MGNFAAVGGAFSSRTYGYDGRGNRTSYVPDGIALTSSYDATRVDQLTAIANAAAGKLWRYSFAYDADGRVTQKTGPIDSSGLPSSTTLYASGPDASGANDTVFMSVTVQGAAYNHFYDALNRRRYKSYPTGTRTSSSTIWGRRRMRSTCAVQLSAMQKRLAAAIRLLGPRAST